MYMSKMKFNATPSPKKRKSNPKRGLLKQKMFTWHSYIGKIFTPLVNRPTPCEGNTFKEVVTIRILNLMMNESMRCCIQGTSYMTSSLSLVLGGMCYTRRLTTWKWNCKHTKYGLDISSLRPSLGENQVLCFHPLLVWVAYVAVFHIYWLIYWNHLVEIKVVCCFGQVESQIGQ